MTCKDGVTEECSENMIQYHLHIGMITEILITTGVYIKYVYYVKGMRTDTL